jgi:hypothetical protein
MKGRQRQWKTQSHGANIELDRLNGRYIGLMNHRSCMEVVVYILSGLTDEYR